VAETVNIGELGAGKSSRTSAALWVLLLELTQWTAWQSWFAMVDTLAHRETMAECSGVHVASRPTRVAMFFAMPTP